MKKRKIFKNFDIKKAIEDKIIKERNIDENVKISNNPVHFLKMGDKLRQDGTASVYSCLSAGGSYEKGVLFWMKLKGCSLAIIERNGIIIARTLLFSLTEQEGIYKSNKIYAANPAAADVLESAVKNFPLPPPGSTVRGYVSEKFSLPFFDRGYAQKVGLKGKEGNFHKVIF